MKIDLAYGKGMETLDIPDENVAAVVYPNDPSGLDDPAAEVERSLVNPIGSPTLREIVSKYKSPKVVIIVNDVTRPVPYKWILPPLMKQLEEVPLHNIDFIVATGIHRPHTDIENRALYSSEFVDKYRFSSHDCDNDVVDCGTLRDGTHISINRKVAEADIVIVTGMISLHYLAGYSGGRKSIIPGVSGRDIITRSHSMMVDPLVKCGCLEDNPINNLMIEGSKKVGLSFIINVVTNSKKEIVRVVSGHMERAWLEGVKVCRDISCYAMERKYPVVIASTGGYPKDINVYQAHKALEYASYATEEGGTIILLAECREGYGEDTFEKWMNDASRPVEVIDRLQEGFELGGHKAYAIARIVSDKEVVLISDLTRERTENLFFHYKKNLSEAVTYIKRKCGRDVQVLIMPEAGATFPVSDER